MFGFLIRVSIHFAQPQPAVGGAVDKFRNRIRTVISISMIKLTARNLNSIANIFYYNPTTYFSSLKKFLVGVGTS